jgi:signal transduction histidine kinase/ActR/RegA family two-component response regulator
LRSGDQIIGLLQLNDKRGGCFTSEKIIFYENLAQNIGLGLQRAAAEQALHENERRLAAILEQLPVGVGLVDRNGHLMLSNSTLQKLIGGHLLPSKDPEQIHRWHFLDAQGEPIAPEQWPGARAIRGEIVSPGMEAFYAGETGERWMLVSAVPFRSGAEILGAILVVQDISARKQGQMELLALTATLERRVAERTELAECRAKQLQSLAVELIEAEERERQRISYLLHEDLQQILAAARLRTEQTLDQASHLTALGEVSEMLSDAIIKSRQLSHELSPAILQHSRLTEALAWLSKRMERQFGIHIELKAETHLELGLESIKVFIFRAVQELLFNVFKHAGVREALVSLTSNGDQFIVTVADNGRGFFPSNLDGSSAKRGLGLLSLRERTSYIGGSLTIESAPDKGCRIKLTIPIKFSLPDVPSPENVNAKSVLTKGGVIRVLLADDHKVMRQGLVQLISGHPGLSIVGEAANGREAVELALKLQPHVVIMDVSMPELDGIEASRRLKAELPQVRIIGLSMFDDEQTARRMYAAGAEAFVAKTASSAELLKVIYGNAWESQKAHPACS